MRAASLANAHDYLTLLGHTMIAHVWLRSAAAASRGLEALRRDAADEPPSDDEVQFYLGKLHTCTFFFRHELPKTAQLARVLGSKDMTVHDMRPGWF